MVFMSLHSQHVYTPFTNMEPVLFAHTMTGSIGLAYAFHTQIQKDKKL